MRNTLYGVCIVILGMLGQSCGIFGGGNGSNGGNGGGVIEKSITLQWVPNTEPNLLSYRVYRGSGECTEQVLNPLVINGSQVTIDKMFDSYIDKNVSSGQVCYEITAVNIHGYESGRSNRVIGVVK